MKFIIPVIFLTLVGCSSSKPKMAESQGEQSESAEAKIESKKGGPEGKVTFKQQGDRILAAIELNGLEKNSTHGIHIHENGVCQGPGFKSAGGHLDPDKHDHGEPGKKNHHLGDLGNITADAKGRATKEILIEKWDRAVDLNNIVDHAVILHAGKDDLKSQPSGDSGDRIACGVIKSL